MPSTTQAQTLLLRVRQGDVLPASASFWVDRIPGLPAPGSGTGFPPIALSNSSASSSSSSTAAQPIGAGPRLQTYAGYLPARPSNAANYANAHLYFVLQRAQHIGSQRRLIIWFNGGPGCSSFDGLMMEIGPWKCRTDKEGELEWAPPGAVWNEYADVIYLDQPAGTGFSYTDSNGYVTSLSQAADEVVHFLRQLVQIFPEYAHGNGYSAYLAGESFAGQYIPYTARAIMDAAPSPPIDLQGIVMGNGFIDPRSQAGSELEMMVQSKIWTTSSPEYVDTLKIVERCKQELEKFTDGYLPRVVPACESVLPTIIHHTTTRKTEKPMCINIYDVRLSDTSPACGMNWPPTLPSMYAYLKRQDVRHALHVDEKNKPQAWIECNSRVGAALHGTTLDKDGHREQASVTLLPALLERGLKVLMFAGDKDLICNHIGVERIGQNLVWGGVKGFGTPAPKPLNWYVNKMYAGQWTSARNYTYVRIADASHMVGFDAPVVAHDMMLRFMGFNDGLGTAELVASAGAGARIPSFLTDKTDPAAALADGERGGRKLALVSGAGAAGAAGVGKVPGLPMIPGVDGKTEAQVAEEAKWAAYYNAGSAALVFLIIAVTIGTCLLLRSRRRSRQMYAPKLGPSYGRDDLEDDRGNGAANGGLGPEGEGDGEEEGAHELTRLVVDHDGADGEPAGRHASSARRGTYFDDRATAGGTYGHGHGEGEGPSSASAEAAELQARSGGRRTPSKVRFTDEPSVVYPPAHPPSSASGGGGISTSSSAGSEYAYSARTPPATAPPAVGSHGHAHGHGRGRDLDGVGRRDEENIFDVGEDEE